MKNQAARVPLQQSLASVQSRSGIGCPSEITCHRLAREVALQSPYTIEQARRGVDALYSCHQDIGAMEGIVYEFLKCVRSR